MNMHPAPCTSTRLDSTHAVFTGVRRAACALTIVCALLALPGCKIFHKSSGCEDSKAPYLKATSQAPIRIPDGLNSPDRSAALSIPPGQNGARASGNKRCLDGPPSYFAGAGTPSAAPEEVVAAWAQAWADRNVQNVIATYAKDFVAPTAAGNAQWLEQRREQIATGAVPNARLEDIKVISQDDRRVVTFVQRFGSNAVRKELTMVRENGFWRILNEQAVGVQ
jgi:hypothetical protein